MSIPAIQQVFQQLDAFLSAQQQSLQLPGLVCSVVYDQDILWSNGYGLNNPFNPKSGPPTVNSVVRIASITKVFTDIMLMYLRDEGVVDLDDPVIKYMPDFSVKNPYMTKRPITLRQLGSHTSGLQREVPCSWYDMYMCTEDEILFNVSQTYLLFPQYNTPHYSNLGLALLGRTLEKAAGIQYETFVENEILQPLGMTSSTFDYDTVKSKMAVGVQEAPNGSLVPAYIENLGWGNPMGGMFSTANDMSNLISLMFRTNALAGGDQIVDGSTINEVLKPVILNNDGYSGFGLPWEFKYIQDYWVKSKAGSLPGYRSQVALVPPIKLGIFCVGTADDDDPTQSMLTEPSLDILIPVFTNVLWSLQPVNPIPPNADVFTGLWQYSDPVDGATLLEIFIAEDQLIAAYTDGANAFGAMNMTQFMDTIFRVQLTEAQECRWLNDGSNDEFIYCTMDPSGEYCDTLVFMGEAYDFQSKSCPQCS